MKRWQAAISTTDLPRSPPGNRVTHVIFTGVSPALDTPHPNESYDIIRREISVLIARVTMKLSMKASSGPSPSLSS